VVVAVDGDPTCDIMATRSIGGCGVAAYANAVPGATITLGDDDSRYSRRGNRCRRWSDGLFRRSEPRVPQVSGGCVLCQWWNAILLLAGEPSRTSVQHRNRAVTSTQSHPTAYSLR